MDCARHGPVELSYSTNSNVPGKDYGTIHYLTCGCHGNSEQLRDPLYDPNPPSADALRVAELEAENAALKEQLGKKGKNA